MNSCYYNGQLVDDRKLVSFYNGSFLYGINCFEGLRGYWDNNTEQLYLLDLNRHIDRLFDSSSRLGFNLTWTQDDFYNLFKDIIANHQIRENIYVRITFFIDGETSWIAQDNISHLISIRTMDSKLHNHKFTSSYRLKVSSILRISESSMPPSIKAGGNYLNSRYAKLDALSHGFDDALMLNHRGYISESTGSCIFFLSKDVIYTPSLDSDILESITRQRIIDICRINDIDIKETHIAYKNIDEMDGAFLCGSMIEIMPITQVDNVTFETGKSQLYLRVVELFQNYLTIENL